MNYWTLLSCLLLAGSSACVAPSPPSDCRRYHDGTFRVYFRHPQYGISFLITRRGKLQTELNEQTGSLSKLAVTWLNDCTYQLRLLETTDHFPKEIEEYRRSTPLTTTILGGTSQYYLFRSQRKSTDPVQSDTIWLVR